MYSADPFEVDPHTTLQIPVQNVATIKNNALVIEGVSRSRNALLNGDTHNYDWDDGKKNFNLYIEFWIIVKMGNIEIYCFYLNNIFYKKIGSKKITLFSLKF